MPSVENIVFCVSYKIINHETKNIRFPDWSGVRESTDDDARRFITPKLEVVSKTELLVRIHVPNRDSNDLGPAHILNACDEVVVASGYHLIPIGMA